MKTGSPKHIIPVVIILLVLYTSQVAFCAHSEPNDPNTRPLISLGTQMKKVVYWVEAAYWPDVNLTDVKTYVTAPNPERKAKFAKLLSRTIHPNYLPEKLAEKIRFLKGWRGEGRETFLLQYDKGLYLIRVKNQVTHIQVTKARRDSSHWITLFMQAKDKRVCVDKGDLNAIFGFVDQFLSDKINSSAQNYSWIKNMDSPRFKEMDTGYMVAYPVGASKPNIDGVIIWTDGHKVLINLKERRKVVRRAK